MSHTEKIFSAQIEAMASGSLNIWTVYDHPADFPHSYVARRYEVGPGGPDGTGHATGDIVQGELSIIRESFRRCGLTRLPRDPNDDATIVEIWL